MGKGFQDRPSCTASVASGLHQHILWKTFLEHLVFVPQPALTAYQRDSARLPRAPHVEELLVGVLVFARVLESTLEHVATSRAEPPETDADTPSLPQREAELRAIAREHRLLAGDPAGNAQERPGGETGLAA